MDKMGPFVVTPRCRMQGVVTHMRRSAMASSCRMRSFLIVHHEKRGGVRRRSRSSTRRDGGADGDVAETQRRGEHVADADDDAGENDDVFRANNAVRMSHAHSITPSTRASGDTMTAGASFAGVYVAERAGAFALSEQSLKQWIRFGALLSFVGAVMWVVWLDPRPGALQLGTAYTSAIERVAGGDKEATMLLLLVLFGVAHSGMAGLRRRAEGVLGARAWRVIFASISLPLATSTLMYFVANRYAGSALWDLRGVAGVHDAVWVLSFVSFFFLYPSTFNLLEVAAIDEPKVHLYETGIIRITRHPQAIGQLLWCVAHLLWTGNSFVAVASVGLMAHHAFGVWHGDRRLKDRYGDAFDVVKARTSVFPFAAIIDGRQPLPPFADFVREFWTAPYAAVVAFTLGAYAVHPLMQMWAHDLHY